MPEDVAIVSVDVPALLAMAVGLNEHEAPLGNPLQDKVTAPLKPKFDSEITVEVAEPPAVTSDGESTLADSSNPGAVVFNSTPAPATSG